jgi:hypothetical protein
MIIVFSWAKWQRDQIELKAEEEQFRAYWQRRKTDDENLWRDKVYITNMLILF